MNDRPELLETLAPIATLRTLLSERRHPATNPADVLLLSSVRDSIAVIFREEFADFAWYLRWLLPFLQWFAYWRIITHLRSKHPDPTAALAHFQAWLAFEPTPPNQTTPLNPLLLEILRCPKDHQPLEQWIDDQGAIWVVNPRLGDQYPVVDGIPLLFKTEVKQLDPAYRSAGQR